MTELPLYMFDFFGRQTGLVLGVALGFGFGFTLERAGFGRSSILAAQFYFTDMRVLKVMFTAIVTALLGITILTGIGVMDLSAMSIPHTYLWPQLFGGLLLGMGFIVSGYCPGTGVVATASGKLDGIFAIFGVMLGSLLFGFGYPLYENFYHSGDLGVFRLPDLLGLPDAVLALGVTAMAIGAFFGAEKLERMFTGRDKESPSYIRAQRPIFTGLVLVAAVGALTMLSPQAGPSQPAYRMETMTPVELAQRSIEAPTSFYLIDLRVLDSDAKHIPGAVPVTGDDPHATFVRDLPTTRALVVYGQSDVETLPHAIVEYGGEVFVLDGGYDAFAAEILEAPVIDENPTPEEIRDYRLRAALHAHFTGAAVLDAPPPPRPKKRIERAGSKKEGGC